MCLLLHVTHVIGMNNDSKSHSQFGQLCICIDFYDRFLNKSPNDYDHPPEDVALYWKQTEIFLWQNTEKEILTKAISQQDMTDIVVYSLAHTLAPNITKKLLILLHDKIDINCVPKKQNGLIPRPLFNEIICEYGKSLYMDPPKKNPTDLYYNEYGPLYFHICDNFKNKLNVNVKHDHQTPFLLTCSRFLLHQQRSLSFNGPEKNLGTFLETFIARFHRDIDFFTTNKDNQNIFNLCEIKDSDEDSLKQNKSALLSLLKKYCLDKSLTKQGLEKAHNCHFLFVKNLDY